MFLAGVRLGVWGVVLVVCVCVSVSGVLFSDGVCVCGLLTLRVEYVFTYFWDAATRIRVTYYGLTLTLKYLTRGVLLLTLTSHHVGVLRQRLRLVSVVAPLLALCSCEWFVLLSCVLLSCACVCDLLIFLDSPATT